MKVLLISHNPFSTYQSMGKTFASLFSSFRKEELCQLYIFPSFPDIDAAESYYRITDRDAIKRICPAVHAGGEVAVHAYQGSMIANETDRKIYTKSSNQAPLKRLLRDVIWKLSRWYSADLQQWLDRESPTCIFLAPGYAKFIYDIALTISRRRNIPIITYICDDNYFLNRPGTLLGQIQLDLLQRKTRQIMDCSKLVVSISREIADQYSRTFSVNSEVIMTGAGFDVAQTAVVTDIKAFSYFGNLDLNRDKSLADIGRVLDEINEQCGKTYCLNVYTRSEVPVAFADVKSIRMCGFLAGDAFIHAFQNAGCLVHVEAFDEKSIDLVKGSVSTKIADSLASGIPLLAYGPAGVASMEHLRRNNCAFLAGDYESLKLIIGELLTDFEKRKIILGNALRTARHYHVSDTNSIHLRSMIQQIAGET